MPEFSGEVLQIEELCLKYPRGIGYAINRFNLRISSRECIALVGPSGCGKSSVARAVLQLLPVGSEYNGRIVLRGQEPNKLSKSGLRQLRGQSVGLVFQDPMTRLNPLISVGGHLVDALKTHLPGKSSSWYFKRSQELLERVGINGDRFWSYPHELSGGMCQRVAIILALALKPPLVIADEPTTSLDTFVASKVMLELTTLCKELGSALLLITHDLAMASQWCNRMAIMACGEIVEEGSTDQILNSPKTDIGKRLVYSARIKQEGLIPVQPHHEKVLEVSELRCWHSLAKWPWSLSWIKTVDGLSFSLYKGEALGLVGTSGCGKSTLCRALMGLVPVRGGQVRFLGKNLLSLKGKSLRQTRKNIQIVFQDPLACLNPHMTVGEAIADPMHIHKMGTRGFVRERVRLLLKEVGLSPPEHFQNRLPHELSGGQQQRVAIARAIALKPKVLICDESLSMLDVEVQSEVLSLLSKLQKKFGLSMLFVTHDLSLATGFCSRVIVLQKGKIVEEGVGNQLLNSPKETITKDLVKSLPKLPLSFSYVDSLPQDSQ